MVDLKEKYSYMITAIFIVYQQHRISFDEKTIYRLIESLIDCDLASINAYTAMTKSLLTDWGVFQDLTPTAKSALIQPN